jgi:C4-dicarboxylate-specific signal transduction histidine kinase
LELERRVETEVAIRRQQEQKALRQSRLAILGELAAGIAHELNQPMQTLSLTLENIMLAIQDKQLSGEYLEQKMNYLFADISRMQDVIEHIRCFSRQSEDAGQSNFDLNQSISNAVGMLRDRFVQKGVKIILKLEDGIAHVSGNQYKFEHVILNLLTNARDAIGERKETDKQLRGEIEIVTKREEKQTIVTVKDNGCGIPLEQQDKVFDIFYTTKSLEKGTGLGLSISAGIVKGMSGTLSIDSTPDVGTIITICIPSQICENGEGAIDGFESTNS